MISTCYNILGLNASTTVMKRILSYSILILLVPFQLLAQKGDYYLHFMGAIKTSKGDAPMTLNLSYDGAKFDHASIRVLSWSTGGAGSPKSNFKKFDADVSQLSISKDGYLSGKISSSVHNSEENEKKQEKGSFEFNINVKIVNKNLIEGDFTGKWNNETEKSGSIMGIYTKEVNTSGSRDVTFLMYTPIHNFKNPDRNYLVGYNLTQESLCGHVHFEKWESNRCTYLQNSQSLHVQQCKIWSRPL